MKIVDSQIHLFGPNAEAYAAQINQRIISPEEVVSAMDGAGVERAYLVPAGGPIANATCIEASKRWPSRFRVMGLVSLDKPEAHDLMTNWEKNSPFVGIRLAFAPFRKVSWLKDGTADWFWPEADRLHLPVMIWAPRQLNEISDLASRYSGIRFVIDHLNLFVDDKGAKVAQTIAELLPLAKFDNVAVKASAMPCHSSEPYPFRDLHNGLESILDRFGPHRVMWGTDLTRLPCSFSEAITMFTKELSFLNNSDLDQVMGGTATRWLGW